MVYTTTALPPHDEHRRLQLHKDISSIRRHLKTNLYHRYPQEVRERLQKEDMPEDWLALSSEVLVRLFGIGEQVLPEWCRTVTWLDYAQQRYDRVRPRLWDLLRPEAYVPQESSGDRGWTLKGDRIIAWEPTDSFGRTHFKWDDVPSTLVDADAGSQGRKVLYRRQVEEFVGQALKRPVRYRYRFW